MGCAAWACGLRGGGRWPPGVGARQGPGHRPTLILGPLQASASPGAGGGLTLAHGLRGDRTQWPARVASASPGQRPPPSCLPPGPARVCALRGSRRPRRIVASEEDAGPAPEPTGQPQLEQPPSPLRRPWTRRHLAARGHSFHRPRVLEGAPVPGPQPVSFQGRQLRGSLPPLTGSLKPHLLGACHHIVPLLYSFLGTRIFPVLQSRRDSHVGSPAQHAIHSLPASASLPPLRIMTCTDQGKWGPCFTSSQEC
eukprot:XP_022282218.1 uncharacterized protein LOC111098424 [Canis lupus familiaris]